MIVEYCPTGEMWTDVLTKPLQDAPFRKMRSILMNMTEHYVDPSEGSGTSADTMFPGMN